MGDKQRSHTREVLGYRSCSQQQAVDVREYDLLPDITENRVIHTERP